MAPPPTTMQDGHVLSDADVAALRRAKTLLENPSFIARLTGLIGMPVEKAIDMLPARVSSSINATTRKALHAALGAALATLDKGRARESREGLHSLAVFMTGAGGGAIGLPGLLIELPLTTSIMLRSIADIARSEEDDLSSPESKLACIEVFALGSRKASDDASESAYFMLRAALAKSVSEAAAYVAEKGVAEAGAPVLVKLVAQVGSRFGVVVSEKAVAQALPLIGAAGGATVNLAFISHFQDVARGHFIVRRLERKHGKELVRSEYERL